MILVKSILVIVLASNLIGGFINAKRYRPIARELTANFAQTSRAAEDDYDDDGTGFEGHYADIKEDEDDDDDDVNLDEDDHEETKANGLINQDLFRTRISQRISKQRPRLSPSVGEKEVPSGGSYGQSKDHRYQRFSGSVARPDTPRLKKWDNPALCINNCLDNSSMTFVRCKSMCT